MTTLTSTGSTRKGHPTGAEPECFDQSPDWQPKEISLGDGRTLVLDDS